MNYQQAKRKVSSKRIIGAVIATPALLSTTISLLKMIYFRVDDGTRLGGILARPLQALVTQAYEQTHPALDFFWKHSPTPDHRSFIQLENGCFLGVYLIIFIGAALFASANKLAKRMRDINQKIEDQIIAESIKGNVIRSREKIEQETEIPKSSIFSQFHQLYLAPILAGLFIALLIKLIGL